MTIKECMWDGYVAETDRLEWMAYMSQLYRDAEYQAIAEGWSFNDVDEIAHQIVLKNYQGINKNA